jgi:hypothetical protein
MMFIGGTRHLQASFISAAPPRPFRELTRYRKTLAQERGAEVSRLHKLLEGRISSSPRGD